MEKDTREIVAFALNFILPGLGICFSGLIHYLKWLLLVGLGLVALHLSLGVRFLASYNLYILLTSQNFHTLSVLQSLAVGFTIAILGARVEYDINEKRE